LHAEINVPDCELLQCARSRDTALPDKLSVVTLIVLVKLPRLVATASAQHLVRVREEMLEMITAPNDPIDRLLQLL
jgi:hypothetical protein